MKNEEYLSDNQMVKFCIGQAAQLSGMQAAMALCRIQAFLFCHYLLILNKAKLNVNILGIMTKCLEGLHSLGNLDCNSQRSPGGG